MMTMRTLENKSSFISDPFDSPEGETVRFTMVRELKDVPPEPPLPFGYRVEAWTAPILPAYASVLAVAFADSPELQLYPKLGSREGCLSLVKELTSGPGFLASGSWLVIFDKEPAAMIISSRLPEEKTGQINVVAVAPRHRRLGIGKHLVTKALWAFKDRHLPLATLRVNRSNRIAVRFFRSSGFQVSEARSYIV